MAEKTDAILEKRETELQIKQEEKREEEKKAEEKKVEAPKPEEKKEEKPTEVKEEKKREVTVERVFVLPLSKAYRKPVSQRGMAALKTLKEFLARHMKSEKVKVTGEVNAFILSRGGKKPPKRIKIKASKDKDGIVLAELAPEKSVA
ncbi:60S ribosomal protein L31 [Candidatus Micrarchaeota archaeon]|nr:60S ribosomal protein L31 [Candidatus Micrarchaeota archaeon]